MAAGNNQDYEDLDAYSPGFDYQANNDQLQLRKSGSGDPIEAASENYNNLHNSSSVSLDSKHDENKPEIQGAASFGHPSTMVESGQNTSKEAEPDKHSKIEKQGSSDRLEQKCSPKNSLMLQ